MITVLCRIRLIGCVTAFAFTAASSQVGLNKLAQSTMNFLSVNTSPKASGMGEAYSVIGVGAEAISFNPAGLCGMQRGVDARIDVMQWIADINYFDAKVAVKLGNYGTVGIHLLTVDYGTINGTSLIYDYEASIYNKGYKDTGPVENVAAYSFGLSYAQFVNTQFSVGGTVKLAGQNLGESTLASGVKKNNASKLVFDAGVKYVTGFKSFSFGMTIRNFASNIKREAVDEQLPLSFTLGGSMDLLDIFDPAHAKDSGLEFGVDFLHQNNYSERVNLGLEYRLLGALSLRGGYQTNRDLASWSAGIGFNTTVEDYAVELNYSYSKFSIFNNVNRFSLGLSF